MSDTVVSMALSSDNAHLLLVLQAKGIEIWDVSKMLATGKAQHCRFRGLPFPSV